MVVGKHMVEQHNEDPKSMENNFRVLRNRESLNVYYTRNIYEQCGRMHATPQSLKGIKKQRCKTFKDNGLKITIDSNKKIVL